MIEVDTSCVSVLKINCVFNLYRMYSGFLRGKSCTRVSLGRLERLIHLQQDTLRYALGWVAFTYQCKTNVR